MIFLFKNIVSLDSSSKGGWGPFHHPSQNNATFCPFITVHIITLLLTTKKPFHFSKVFLYLYQTDTQNDWEFNALNFKAGL